MSEFASFMPKRLYIPHGSDESQKGMSCPLRPPHFISHMVQMKVHQHIFFQVPLFALYPTWFRWKCSDCVRKTFDEVLYIPHGSDESMIYLEIYYSLTSLYPTWFRWKWGVNRSTPFRQMTFISHMVQMKVKVRLFVCQMKRILYIPHGSDESQKSDRRCNCK